RSPSMVIAPAARWSSMGGVGGGVSALAETMTHRHTPTTTAADFCMRSFSIRSLTQLRRRSSDLVSDLCLASYRRRARSAFGVRSLRTALADGDKRPQSEARHVDAMPSYVRGR